MGRMGERFRTEDSEDAEKECVQQGSCADDCVPKCNLGMREGDDADIVSSHVSGENFDRRYMRADEGGLGTG